MNEWPFISIHTNMCKYTGKELPWSIMLVTRFTRVTPCMVNIKILCYIGYHLWIQLGCVIYSESVYLFFISVELSIYHNIVSSRHCCVLVSNRYTPLVRISDRWSEVLQHLFIYIKVTSLNVCVNKKCWLVV